MKLISDYGIPYASILDNKNSGNNNSIVHLPAVCRRGFVIDLFESVGGKSYK